MIDEISIWTRSLLGADFSLCFAICGISGINSYPKESTDLCLEQFISRSNSIYPGNFLVDVYDNGSDFYWYFRVPFYFDDVCVIRLVEGLMKDKYKSEKDIFCLASYIYRGYCVKQITLYWNSIDGFRKKEEVYGSMGI